MGKKFIDNPTNGAELRLIDLVYKQELQRGLSVPGNVVMGLANVSPVMAAFTYALAAFATVGTATAGGTILQCINVLCIGLILGELGSVYPVSGGLYSITRYVLPKPLVFLGVFNFMIQAFIYIPAIAMGVGTYMQLLTAELGKLVELHVVTHKETNPLELKNCHVHFIENNNPFLPKEKKNFIFLLNEIKPDVFHANCCWLPMSAYTAMWARNAGYHVVYTPHGMLEPWIMKRHYWTKKFPASLLFQKRGIQIANVIHATAESEKHNLTQLGWNNNIEVIPNCVEIDKITMKESWIRNKNILFLSRVHVKKGINFLIEATANLKTELQGYTINIAGEGEESYINELKQLASKLGVENLIHFIGGVYGDKKWELFKKADLFVLPTHSENFGIVVAEALACGTPVITTQGTPWQELESYHCGWWTEIGTEATTKALKEFLQCTETQLEQMGKNGRKLIEEKYSSQKVAQDMVELYKKVCL